MITCDVVVSGEGLHLFIGGDFEGALRKAICVIPDDV